MDDQAPKSRISADIAYHDYLALLVRLDTPWPWSIPDDERRFPSHRNHREFAGKCFRYGSRLVKNSHNFHAAHASPKRDLLAHYLYNPVGFYTLGKVGDLVLILLDDIDAVQHLLAEAAGKLDDVSVGFCPDLLGAGLGGNLLRNLHDLPNEEFNRCNEEGDLKKIEAEVRNTAPSTHGFQGETPLLVFTKYKMYGLASIGQGLLVQQAIFKAMASRLEWVIQDLREAKIEPAVSPEDADTVRCCFLDLSGAEEIGTLILTRNYTVAASLILAMKSLTFDDIFRADPRVQNLLRVSLVHTKVVQWADSRIKGDGDCTDRIRHNHVFQWTQSSLGISPAIASADARLDCSGYLKVVTELQLAPGHHARAEGSACEIQLNTAEQEATEWANEFGCRNFVVGTADLALFHGTTPMASNPTSAGVLTDRDRIVEPVGRSELPLVQTVSVVNALKENVARFDKPPHPFFGTDVIRITNRVVIPVPFLPSSTGPQDLICGHVDEDEHFAPLIKLLPVLSARLCRPSGCEEPGIPLGDLSGRLSIQELKERLSEAGIPVSLRRTIRYLYQSFATILADPCMFDVVLDLYDTFAALHAVLTEHLPEKRQSDQKRSGARAGMLEDERTRQIAAIVDAMQDALIHRTAKAYPDISFWDMARDFQGGLNQLVLAADAPMKCGLGIARLYATQDSMRRPSIDRLGTLARIGPEPGAKCNFLVLGTENKARLAYMSLDVPHVVHMASYYDLAHEGCHMVYNELAESPSSTEAVFRVQHTKVLKEWISETFATMLGQVIVFGGDVDAALFNCVASYSRSVVSVGKDDVDTIVRFVTVLIRCFLVSDPFQQCGGDDEKVAAILEADWPGLNESTRDAYARFVDMVRRVGPFFSEYERLMDKQESADAFHEYCRDEFRNIFQQIRPYMPELWIKVREVCARYRENEILPDGNVELPSGVELMKEIDHALETGRPLVRSLYETDRNEGTGGRKPLDLAADEYDPFLSRPFLIFGVLRCYIRTITSLFDEKTGKMRRVHLIPDEEGMPVFDKPANSSGIFSGEWYPFQCETGRTAMCCPLPSKRRERLRKHIAIIKTFWDVSSNLRARRLCRMVLENFPELTQEPAQEETDVN